MKSLRLASFLALCSPSPPVTTGRHSPTFRPPIRIPTTDPGESATVMYGQVVNGRTQPVPAAKVVLIWGYFGAMFPPFGDSVNLNGTFPEAFQLALPAPPPADRMFLPSGAFPIGYFDPIGGEPDRDRPDPDREARGQHRDLDSERGHHRGAEDYALVYAEHDVAAGTAGRPIWAARSRPDTTS